MLIVSGARRTFEVQWHPQLRHSLALFYRSVYLAVSVFLFWEIELTDIVFCSESVTTFGGWLCVPNVHPAAPLTIRNDRCGGRKRYY